MPLMELPTREAIEEHPTLCLTRLQMLRREIDECESLAISVAMRRGWKLISLARILGISRQALTQRMQRKLQTRKPNMILREVALADRVADNLVRNAEAMERIWARDRERAN